MKLTFLKNPMFWVLLVVLCVVTGFNPLTIFHTSITDPVASYSLSSTADAMGGTSLTNTNGVSFASAGKVGNGASFVRTSSQALTLSSSPISPISSWTTSQWIKPTGNGGAGICAQTGPYGFSYFGQVNANVQVYQCVNSNGKVEINRQRPGTANDLLAGSTSLPANEWSHVCTSWDSASGATKIYVNGVLDGSATFTGTGSQVANSNGFMIGVGYDGALVGYFNGMIDGVNLYQSSDSSTLCPALYNSGAGIEYPFNTRSCEDGVLNGDETSVDTGGSCVSTPAVVEETPASSSTTTQKLGKTPSSSSNHVKEKTSDLLSLLKEKISSFLQSLKDKVAR
jgi:hypothetical protein